MINVFLCVTDETIRDFFLPLKGAFRLVAPKDLPEALKTESFERVYLWVANPELKPQVQKILAPFDQNKFKLLENSQEALGIGLKFLTDRLSPAEIERLSFELIDAFMSLETKDPLKRVVLKRIIHATGDPDFARTLCFHPEALSFGLEALRQGKDILVDVEMLRAGINQKRLSALGGKILCGLPEIKTLPQGKTRTETAIEMMLAKHPDIGIVAVGNAPTALLATLRFLRENQRKVLIVGLPVGFVKAQEAKLLLLAQQNPYITNFGPRGGTPAASAALNALIGLAYEKAR